MAEEKKEDIKAAKIGWCAYILYYCVLFLAYWFGSSRFDMDGDGDFDPSDVQAFLQDKGMFLQKNYARSDAAVQRSQIVKSKSNLSNNVASGDKKESNVEKKPESNTKTVAVDEEKGDAPAGEQDGEGQGRNSGAINFLDRDGDGDVDAADLIFSKVEGGGDGQEAAAIKAMASGHMLPIFMLGECFVCGILWIIWAGINCGNGKGDYFAQKAGLDSFWEERTDLRFYGDACEDLRPEAWRWWTYQFTHVGAQHIVMNIFLNIMLGIPLEGMHGHLRMAAMFNLGVIGGAFGNFILDQHVAVVGCSGGCYALIGIHVADLIMNWAQKKFRLPTFFLLAALIAADIGSNIAAQKEGVSHAAHIGGAFTGILAGICIGKNLVWKCYEKVLAVIAVILGLTYIVFSLAWLYTREHGPENIFDKGVPGPCWINQAFNEEWTTVEQFKCVSCSTRACVLHWQSIAECYGVDAAKVCPEFGWIYQEYTPH